MGRESYFEFAVASDMDMEYATATFAVMTLPAFLISSVLVVIAAIFGTQLGCVLLKKYFVKAGIL
jgi:hypothetical protein